MALEEYSKELAAQRAPKLVDGNGRGPGGSEEPSQNTGKTYRCTRPLKQPGSKEPCSGELCHEYLCADKNGNMRCWGLNPSKNILPGMPGWVLSPGVNNRDDQYHPENCTEVSSNFCMSKCVRKKFDPENPPLYGYGPQGTDCHEWADDTIATCEKKCKGATGGRWSSLKWVYEGRLSFAG